jgi:hypothetical protein
VLRAVKEVNVLIAESGIQIELFGRSEGDGSKPRKKGRKKAGRPGKPDIVFYFADPSEYPAIAAIHNFSCRRGKGNRPVTTNRWSRRTKELLLSMSLIDAGVTDPEQIRAATLISVVRAVGLLGTSARVRESLFYRRGGVARGGSELTEADKKLVTFFYTRLKPGNGPKQVYRAFDRYWK